MTDIYAKIEQAKNQTELSEIVESYLAEIGQDLESIGETFEETAERLGDDVMEAAATRWWTLPE